ncbi:MAG: phosphoserine phosphatase [Conexibacter sp.]|jgi:phosphoserine phosphatase|nr:phosphoserine phosphatase [Conexibacter sp.]
MLRPGVSSRRRAAARRPRVIEQFLFDLDGTITRQEILPEIARAIGVEDEIAELTTRTMAGELPFESSLRRRVEILSAVPISQVRAIVAGIEVDPHIEAFLKANRDRCTIVTGNLDVWIADLVARLGVPCRSSVAAARGDRLLGLRHVLDKADVARDFSGPICSIGDGYNDLGLMAAADLGVAYGGVHAPAPGLLEVASHAIFDPQTLCRLLSEW